MPVYDPELWDVYVKNVTPLGQAGPSPPELAVERILQGSRLDLHGLSVEDAYSATMDFLNGATGSVTVVTGQSGPIRREFPQWIERIKHARIEELNGGGAFRIHFRRKR